MPPATLPAIAPVLFFLLEGCDDETLEVTVVNSVAGWLDELKIGVGVVEASCHEHGFRGRIRPCLVYLPDSDVFSNTEVVSSSRPSI